MENENITYEDIVSDSTAIETVEESTVEFNSFAETVGEMVGSFFHSLWLLLSTLVIDVANLLGTFFKFIGRSIKNAISESSASIRAEWAEFKLECVEQKHGLRGLRQVFKSHPSMFSTIINTALPICGFIVLIATITHLNSTTYAIEVDSSGKSVGIVADEAVYVNAQDLVKERFSTDLGADDNVSSLTTSYKIVEAKPTEITDSQTVSDNIVESTNSDSTYACGVYIDGEFICALKTETDAMQVFNNIIDGYEKENPNDVVGFTQDVKFVQGIYANNEETIWDSQQLADTLTKTRYKEQHYTVKEGDTLSNIANTHGLSVTELIALNPEHEKEIHVGDDILVAGDVNYVNLKVVKTVVKNEEIPFKTVKTENSSIYKGTTKTTQKGVNGIDQVTYMVTYVDGVQTGIQEVNRTTIRNPVDQKISVGTKAIVKQTSKSTGYTYTPSTYVASYGKLVWPAPGVYVVSSPYGPRWGSFHGGIDLSVGRAGSTIVAAASGTVTVASNGNSGYGTYVMINHNNGMETLYAHMIYGSICVSTGQYVSAGQPIGIMGSTGNSTGPHLHFEVRYRGEK
ncbi:MAG: M23 family metallopeptidase, partial [Clostridia bacterium]|nr:M23 family metallopeptidase [Clostridia bacterium]